MCLPRTLIFVMQGVFQTPYWRDHGDILSAWIIGTAGAVRYELPPEATSAQFARTHVYGYLLATVSSEGANTKDPIKFEFQEVSEEVVPIDIRQRFGDSFIRVLSRQLATLTGFG